LRWINALVLPLGASASALSGLLLLSLGWKPGSVALWVAAGVLLSGATVLAVCAWVRARFRHGSEALTPEDARSVVERIERPRLAVTLFTGCAGIASLGASVASALFEATTGATWFALLGGLLLAVSTRRFLHRRPFGT
jgi:hypothetical protein